MLYLLGTSSGLVFLTFQGCDLCGYYIVLLSASTKAKSEQHFKCTAYPRWSLSPVSRDSYLIKKAILIIAFRRRRYHFHRAIPPGQGRIQRQHHSGADQVQRRYGYQQKRGF